MPPSIWKRTQIATGYRKIPFRLWRVRSACLVIKVACLSKQMLNSRTGCLACYLSVPDPSDQIVQTIGDGLTIQQFGNVRFRNGKGKG